MKNRLTVVALCGLLHGTVSKATDDGIKKNREWYAKASVGERIFTMRGQWKARQLSQLDISSKIEGGWIWQKQLQNETIRCTCTKPDGTVIESVREGNVLDWEPLRALTPVEIKAFEQKKDQCDKIKDGEYRLTESMPLEKEEYNRLTDEQKIALATVGMITIAGFLYYYKEPVQKKLNTVVEWTGDKAMRIAYGFGRVFNYLFPSIEKIKFKKKPQNRQ